MTDDPYVSQAAVDAAYSCIHGELRHDAAACQRVERSFPRREWAEAVKRAMELPAPPQEPSAQIPLFK